MKIILSCFFLGDLCFGTTSSKGGFRSLKHERVSLLYSDSNPETPAHELCHALGLPHTFNGSTTRAKYVYQDGMTDNIMDYSDLIGASRQSLFHWQWKAINSKLP